MLGSQAVVSVVGLACLPFLARNLGPAGYGQFSLFLTGLGLLSSLDLARPTLVRELSGPSRSRDLGPLLSLTGASQLWLTPAAFALGTWLFGAAAGAALALGVFFFVAASGPYALLASEGRVGVAAATRNFGWAAAFLTTTGLSTLELPPHAFLWPFVLANVAIFAVNRHLAGVSSVALFARPDAALISRYRDRSLDILGLGLAMAVVVSVDKLMLQRGASDEVFGAYAAQYDLAIKLNLFGSALGAVLLPTLSHQVAERGLVPAAERLVDRLSRVTVAYFALVALLILFHEPILRWMLGPGFVEGPRLYPWLLVGVFLSLFGHVLTPWQRACGDFRTHRRAYAVSATLMVAVGAFAIPHYGALGALATYLTGRVADVLLVAAEVARLPRAVLPTWRLITLAAMLTTLVVLAALQAVPAGGTP